MAALRGDPRSPVDAGRIFDALHGDVTAEERHAVVDELITNPDAAEAWRLAQDLAPPASATSAMPPDRGAWRWWAAAAVAVVAFGVGSQFASPWRSVEPPVYRGTEQRAIGSLLPSGQPLSRSTPVLRWTGIDGARYRLTVLTPALDVVEEVGNLTTPEYTVSADALARFPRARSCSGKWRRGSRVRGASRPQRLVCELNNAVAKEKAMAMSFKVLSGHVGAWGRYRIKAAAFLICLTVSFLSIGVQAERAVERTWEARSNVKSFLSGHLVRVMMVEAGAPMVTSRAVIELRDRANRVVARKEADLSPSLHVLLDFKVGQKAGIVQLYAFIRVTGELTAPLVTFEDVNPDLGIVIERDPPCGPGSIRVDPQAYCPGWLELTSTRE